MSVNIERSSTITFHLFNKTRFIFCRCVNVKKVQQLKSKSKVTDVVLYQVFILCTAILYLPIRSSEIICTCHAGLFIFEQSTCVSDTLLRLAWLSFIECCGTLK